MKFTKGCWLDRDGVEIHSAAQVREARVEDGRLVLYVVPYAEDRRGMGGPVLGITVSSPGKDIIRTEVCHFDGSCRKIPTFDLRIEKTAPEIRTGPDCVSLKSGDTKLVITYNPCTFTYYYRDKRIAGVGNTSGRAMISTIAVRDEELMDKQLDLKLIGSSSSAFRTQNYMRVQMDVDIGEKIYGLGERFTPFVRNGQSFTAWNEDGGTSSDLSYKCIPFYVTNRNYGVFVNDTGPVAYEICSEQVERVQFSVPGEKLDFMVIGGASMKDVLVRYTALTGRPALPPAWSFGLWLTTSSETRYDEEKVMELVDGMLSRDIPLHVFLFDAFSTKENEWVSFQWDRSIFPHAEELLRVLKEEKGLKLCYWLNSYIAQRSPLFREAKEKGYLIRKPDGDVWQWDLWQAGMGIVDFTNPEAWRWYQDRLRPLIEAGIDTIKTDFGERIPTDAVFHDGSDPLHMHNYYTYLYNKCVFELLQETKGADEACLFARSATAGSQRFPVHWGGDPTSDYLSMAESIRAGLSLCLSGFGFWSHDISGYQGTATADLYKRWTAFGLLSTHSRLHGTTFRVPWLFSGEGEENGEESVAVLKAFTELKCTLMPYIFSAAAEAHRTGVPVMRAMVLEFPGDLSCEDLDRQYMLGERLLVAPVLSADGSASYYLPEGRWTHFLSNEVREGGRWMRDRYDYFSLPFYVRENSIVPVGNDRRKPDYDYLSGLTLHVFELNGRAETEVCDEKGVPALRVRAENEGGRITIRLEGRTGDLRIRLRNVGEIRDLSGAVREESGEDVLLRVKENEIAFRRI